MDMADNWLGVPKLLTPEEMVNPNVDDMSMMTYLSQFPNAKVGVTGIQRSSTSLSSMVELNFTFKKRAEKKIQIFC